jgi:hypothetical protein
LRVRAARALRASVRAWALADAGTATALQNRTMTLRERDTTEQRIGGIDDVVAAVVDLVDGRIAWAEACERLAPYDGVQAVE